MLDLQHLSTVTLSESSSQLKNVNKVQNQQNGSICENNNCDDNNKITNIITTITTAEEAAATDILTTESVKENNNINNDNKINVKEEKTYSYFGLKFFAPFKWLNLISITIFHLYAVYCMIRYLSLATLYTTLWAFTTGGLGGFGVTAGVHRLWSHKAYKAKLPLRIILMICYSIAGQNTMFDWVRDHRVHHKFSETDADPHNSNRGFFFAHVGWLMMRKHPEVIAKGNIIDMSDIASDPVIRFHTRYFLLLKIVFCFIMPTVVPIYFWNETWFCAFISQVMIRYVFGLNFTWLVNSAAHMWGYRPYDKKINPAENIGVAIVAMGEGWHNYHHVFPWDYKAAELGNYTFNVTTFWIDMFAKIGWAYDLKQPSKELLQKIVEKTGDGSHPAFGHSHHHIEEVPDPDEDENANFPDMKKKQ